MCQRGTAILIRSPRRHIYSEEYTVARFSLLFRHVTPCVTRVVGPVLPCVYRIAANRGVSPCFIVSCLAVPYRVPCAVCRVSCVVCRVSCIVYRVPIVPCRAVPCRVVTLDHLDIYALPRTLQLSPDDGSCMCCMDRGTSAYERPKPQPVRQFRAAQCSCIPPRQLAGSLPPTRLPILPAVPPFLDPLLPTEW